MKRQRESGFAMLLVFLMSASIAIMLYMQLPRAAFEAQRAKEELLQERGEQYIRAIQLYVAKWRSYPPSMDSLEKANGIRYLRKRYKDPMTGKDEWRLIHVNAAGQLVDSLIKKKEDEKKPNLNNFISEAPAIGSTGTNTEAAQNAALRRRPSDQTPVAGAPGVNAPIDPASLGNGAQIANPATSPNGQIAQPGQPIQPGQPGQPFQPNQFPAQQPFGQQQLPVQPGQQPFGQQQQPVQPGQPQHAANTGLPYPVPAAPGAGGFGAQPNNAAPQPGQPNQPGQPGQPGTPNQGIDMINKILTTPRSQMNMAVAGAPGLQIGGGIAGVASVFEGPSIKVYNEREKYQEWEFVYDMKKDKRLLGAAAGVANQQNNNPLGNNQNPRQVPNPMTNGSGSSFNNSGSSFNNSGSSFNNSGSSFNNPGQNTGTQQPQQPVQNPGFSQPGRGR
jgi:hypothetical protein